MISLFADRFKKDISDEKIVLSLDGRYMLSSQNGGKSK